MYLLLYILFLVLMLNMISVKESFVSKSILSTIMDASPNSVLEGMYKKVHPYIPFKNRYHKLRRHLRLK
jgi:hypothetical protein